MSQSPQEAIFGMALGYFISRALHVATALGIADLLKDGPKSVGELAAATESHEKSLHRLLRALAAHGVFSEESTGRFSLTPTATVLQEGVPGSVRDAVHDRRSDGDGAWWVAVGDRSHSVMTGEPAFQHHQGIGFFEYLVRHLPSGRVVRSRARELQRSGERSDRRSVRLRAVPPSG